MFLNNVLTKDMAERLVLTRPPEPPLQLLLKMLDNGIYVGRSLELKEPVSWNPVYLTNPHIAVLGVTGSGKSFLVKTLITRASAVWDASALILDWSGEYVKWVKHAGGRVIDLSSETIDIFNLPGNRGERITAILSALDILIGLDKFEQEKLAIQEALDKLFRKKNPSFPELLKILKKDKKQTAYALIKRLYLQGKTFFSSQPTVKFEEMVSGLVCLDLHNLPSEQVRTMVALTVLQYVKEKMRSSEDATREKTAVPKLIVVLDEAWKLASDDKSDVITIIREGRKYNFSVIVASQNPTDINPTILNNVGTVFVFQLLLHEYREYMRKALNFPSMYLPQIASFPVGRCLIHFSFTSGTTIFDSFIVDRVDGEDMISRYALSGDDMRLEFDKEEFIDKLYEFGLNADEISKIRDEFDRNDGELNAVRFLELLENFGYSRGKVLLLLREIGIKERDIIRMFALLRQKKAHEAGTKTATMILEGEENGA